MGEIPALLRHFLILELLLKSLASMSSASPESSSSEHRSPTVCYLCRQRKTKCDRTLPRCGFCVKAKVECRYVARPKKRGLRAGYVSQLETRIENLEEQLASLKQQQQHRPPSMEFAAAAMPTPTPGPVATPTPGPNQVPPTTLSPHNPPFASPAASIASTI